MISPRKEVQVSLSLIINNEDALITNFTLITHLIILILDGVPFIPDQRENYIQCKITTVFVP